VLGTPRWRRWTLGAAGAVALMVLTIAVYRLVAPAPRSANWSGKLLGGPEIAFRPRPSPDGNLVGFFAVDEGYTQVGVMKPETGNWSMLTHSRQHGNVNDVAWAPDGSPYTMTASRPCPQGILQRASARRRRAPRIPPGIPAGSAAGRSLLAVKLNSRREWQLFRLWPATGQVQDLPVAVIDPGQSLANPRVFPDGKSLDRWSAAGAGSGRHETAGRGSCHRRHAAFRAQYPRGTGAPDFAVSRDGKSVLITLELGRVYAGALRPAHGRGPAQTLLPRPTKSGAWILPRRKRVCLRNGPPGGTSEPPAGPRSDGNVGSVSGGV